MTRIRKLFVISAVAAGSAALLAVPASAHRFGGFGGRGPFGGHFGGLRVKPDPECLRICGQVNQLCLQSARTDAQTCADAKCGSDLQTAQAACAADHTSTDCQNARSMLRTCLQPCRDTLKTDASTCQTDKRGCVAACASSAPSVPDPQCVAGCRSTQQTCRGDAAMEAQSCLGQCDSLITTARQTCIANPRASACRTALQAAQGCVRPCNQTEQSALQSCQQTAQSCSAACPTVSPTPISTATPVP
jgi:hypothetical protein